MQITWVNVFFSSDHLTLKHIAAAAAAAADSSRVRPLSAFQNNNSPISLNSNLIGIYNRLQIYPNVTPVWSAKLRGTEINRFLLTDVFARVSQHSDVSNTSVDINVLTQLLAGFYWLPITMSTDTQMHITQRPSAIHSTSKSATLSNGSLQVASIRAELKSVGGVWKMVWF